MRCTRCKETQPDSRFAPDKRKANGLRSWCKSCESETAKAWRLKNPAQVVENNRRYRVEFPERYLEGQRRFRAEHPDVMAAANKRWRIANPDKVLAMRRRTDKRRQADPQHRLSNTISRAVNKTLKSGKGGYSWEQLVGYTLSDVIRHIEKLFLPGMAWDNRGAWHIDHIMPIAAFEFTTASDSQFKQCWALENLQPLWALDNMRKRDKLPERR